MNFQFSIFNFKKRFAEGERGFTLVETLVSLVILTVAMIPVLNLSTAAARANSALEDNLVATGLAQEGVEVIRAIRDTNWFNNRSFDTGLSDGIVGHTTTANIEWNSTALGAYLITPLNLNNGRYTYSGGTPSKFSRTVTITRVNVGELKVVSQVTWTDRSNNAKSISAEDHLFNWK